MITNPQPHGDDPVSRRAALRRGAIGLLGLSATSLLASGCSGAGAKAGGLPRPLWPETPTRTGTHVGHARPTTAERRWASPEPIPPTRHPGVIARSTWARGQPVPSLMDPMLPVRRITLHHDGMSPFTSTAYADAADRLEAIRRAHRGHHWGDIGYHYVIDPAGRVWAGRPLTYQGAHVRDQNEGNIGVCVLGNYERQFPNEAQLNTVEHFVADLMRHYNVGVREVHTHRELAPTACPGRNLQPRLVTLRRSGGGLATV